MTLQNLYEITKQDQYTADGRAAVEDARRTYKPGEISEATGLQKQTDGSWAPPKTGKSGLSHSEIKEAKKDWEDSGFSFNNEEAKKDKPAEPKKPAGETKPAEPKKSGKETPSKGKTDWRNAKIGLSNQNGIAEGLSNIGFMLSHAWADKHGIPREEVDGYEAEAKLIGKLLRQLDWNNPEKAVKELNNLAIGYDDWQVAEKSKDRVKLTRKERRGNTLDLVINVPTETKKATGDAAPRLTADTRIRVKK